VDRRAEVNVIVEGGRKLGAKDVSVAQSWAAPSVQFIFIEYPAAKKLRGRHPNDCDFRVLDYNLDNRYSVPYRFAGRPSNHQILDMLFSVFVSFENVCTHDILPDRDKISRCSVSRLLSPVENTK